MLKKFIAASTLGLAIAGGTLAAATPATAGQVPCRESRFSSANGGNAWARGCDHVGADHAVRLVAVCNFLPGNGYSAWAAGTFFNYNFDTTSCTFGANASKFQHGR